MPYTFNTAEDESAMLASIGVARLDELFSSIPADLRLKRPLDLPRALSELELQQHIEALASGNRGPGKCICFLGGGSYDHFIPAAVDALASRGEFYTSYTPYQAEVSQGNLQVMFEYQTLMCQLTGMDVSNASLYDGGSAVVEGVLMCMSVSKRHEKVVVLQSANPEYRQVIDTYLANIGTEVVTVPAPQGVADVSAVAAHLDGRTACLVVQHPNFFGVLEPMQQLVAAARRHGVRVVQVFNPISLGLLKNPGQLGADVAVAEGQSLGSPMAYGGPYLGILACREEFLRRVPGRITGQTVSANGKRCWVLTLQTREQHIRREKATSNICTNQTLFALRAGIYLALLGPQGLREVAELCARKAHYLADRLSAGGRLQRAFDAPFFHEFVIRDADHRVADLLAQAEEMGFLAGIPLERWYPDMADCFLVAVTEKRTRGEMDGLARSLSRSEARARKVHA